MAVRLPDLTVLCPTCMVVVAGAYFGCDAPQCGLKLVPWVSSYTKSKDQLELPFIQESENEAVELTVGFDPESRVTDAAGTPAD